MRKSTIFSSGNLRRQIFKMMAIGVAGIFSASVANGQMSAGTYYIDGGQPTGGNSYQSFAAFFSALNTAGNAISSPGILLKVKPQANGYNEQFTVPSISGLGPIQGGESRLTIQGDGTANTRVYYAADASTNSYSVVFIDGASYITLDSLIIDNTASSGYNYAVKVFKGSERVDVTNSTLKTRTNGYSSGYGYCIAYSDGTTSPSGDATNPKNCVIDNCQILGGYYGAYLYGGASSSGPWPAGNKFTNNFIQGQYYYGVYMYYQDGMEVSGNTYDGSQAGSTSHYGFMMYYQNNAKVTNNTINHPGAYGFYMYYWNYYNTGIVSGRSLFANNAVHGNSTYNYGYGAYAYRANTLDYVYNSIWHDGNNTTSYGLYCYYNDDIKVLNNAIKFSTGGTKYGTYLYNLTNSTVDYNTIYDETGGMVYYNSGSSYSTLSSFQSATGYQMNGQEADPSFIAVDDLHVNGANLYGKGTPVATIAVDVDGTTRSATAPSPGIHEFMPPNNDAGVVTFTQPVAQCADTNQIEVVVKNYGILPLTSFWIYWEWNGNSSAVGPLDSMLITASPGLIAGADTTLYLDDVIMTTGAPGYNFTAYTSRPNNVTDETFDNDTMHYYTQTAMEGTYTIGGATPDFATFSDAVTGLGVFGVCGAVTFHARGGTYTEQVTLGSFIGVDAMNTITFTTDPANTTPVKVEYTSTGAGDQGVFMLNNSSYVTIDGYDIENKGGSYSRAFYVDGGSSHITFSNNTCTVPTGTSSLMIPIYIYNYNVASEDINILNNTVSGGYYGIYAYNYNSGSAGCDGMNIIGNDVSNGYYYGIYCYYNKNVVVDNNVVNVLGGSASPYSYGIYIYGYGSTGFDVRGNDVKAGRYPFYAYYLSGTGNKYGEITNNQFVAGDTTNGIDGYYGMYFYNGGFMRISHNLFLQQSKSTSGYGVYIYGGLNQVYNNIFHKVGPGTNLYINGGFTITEMDNNAYCSPQAASNNLTYTQNLGFDANGIEVDSIYGNLDSLFTCLDDLVAAGAPLSYVNNDLYGGGRSTTAPTIGPIEYISPDAFSLGEEGLSICDGDTLILGSEISGASYLWTNGDTTGTIMVTSPGNYGVSVSTGCGNATDDIDVEDAASVADFIPDSSWMTITFTNTSQKAVTYMWDFGDGTNSTDMNPVHLYTATGMYNVCLTATGECDENTTCQMVRAWNGVGINENNGANNISIYPNPASNLLTIEADGVNGNVMSVEISNISGQIVMNSQLNDFNGYAKEQLDISELTKGVYFVKIYTNEVTTTKRLVVQK